MVNKDEYFCTCTCVLVHVVHLQSSVFLYVVMKPTCVFIYLFLWVKMPVNKYDNDRWCAFSKQVEIVLDRRRNTQGMHVSERNIPREYTQLEMSYTFPHVV